MAERLEVYKCNICNNIVEVLTGGAGALVCCGQDMVNMKENTVDAAQEKHVPVATKVDGGWEVAVGSVAHPMEEKHLINNMDKIAHLPAIIIHGQQRKTYIWNCIVE